MLWRKAWDIANIRWLKTQNKQCTSKSVKRSPSSKGFWSKPFNQLSGEHVKKEKSDTFYTSQISLHLCLHNSTPFQWPVTATSASFCTEGPPFCTWLLSDDHISIRPGRSKADVHNPPKHCFWFKGRPSAWKSIIEIKGGPSGWTLYYNSPTALDQNLISENQIGLKFTGYVSWSASLSVSMFHFRSPQKPLHGYWINAFRAWATKRQSIRETFPFVSRRQLKKPCHGMWKVRN